MASRSTETRLDKATPLADVYAAEIRRLVALGTILAGEGAAGEDLASGCVPQLGAPRAAKPGLLARAGLAPPPNHYRAPGVAAPTRSRT